MENHKEGSWICSVQQRERQHKIAAHGRIAESTPENTASSKQTLTCS